MKFFLLVAIVVLGTITFARNNNNNMMGYGGCHGETGYSSQNEREYRCHSVFFEKKDHLSIQ